MSKTFLKCIPEKASIAFCLSVLAAIFSPSAVANFFDQCLLEEIQSADDGTPIGDIKLKCRAKATANLQTLRYQASSKEKDKRFELIPYKANYVLPVTYSWNPAGSALDVRDDELDNEEVKFQFSLKVPIYNDLPLLNADLYFAYTQLSLWQAYNGSVSSPFRETNYEPEIFISADNDMEILGFTNIQNSFGLVHQSNGQGAELSRSWNRFYLKLMFERGNFTWAIKPWWRIPESYKDNPQDVGGDDNPDIEHFMGSFEWTGLYQWRDHNFSLLARNNFRPENRGAIELGWSFPVTKNIRLYMQYFNGYGESLINYDNNTNRFGIGFELTDWL